MLGVSRMCHRLSVWRPLRRTAFQFSGIFRRQTLPSCHRSCSQDDGQSNLAIPKSIPLGSLLRTTRQALCCTLSGTTAGHARSGSQSTSKINCDPGIHARQRGTSRASRTFGWLRATSHCTGDQCSNRSSSCREWVRCDRSSGTRLLWRIEYAYGRCEYGSKASRRKFGPFSGRPTGDPHECGGLWKRYEGVRIAFSRASTAGKSHTFRKPYSRHQSVSKFDRIATHPAASKADTGCVPRCLSFSSCSRNYVGAKEDS